MRSIISTEDGGHPQHAYVGTKQINLGVSLPQTDHDYCGLLTKRTECRGQLGVQEPRRFLRMASPQKRVQQNSDSPGKARSGSVCITTVSASTVYGVEARPEQHCNICNATIVEGAVRLCVPPFQFDKSGDKENKAREGPRLDSSYTLVANTAMVCTASADVLPSSSTSASEIKPTKKPSRNQPSTSAARAKISGVENFRNSLQIGGISKGAATLISQSRRESLITNYESSFQKWVSWCSEGQVNPFQANLKDILNYLAYLFQEGYQYRTINSHRSAISAYHPHIDGRPVGEHPKLCDLLAGAFNQRPPQPRYTFIWDVDVVLKFIKSNMGNDLDLSEGDLAHKLTALLALAAAQRVSAIQHLNIDFMAKTNSQVTFYFTKLHKSWRRGKPPPELTYQAYPEDESLCVVRTLENYLDKTKKWRKIGGMGNYC